MCNHTVSTLDGLRRPEIAIEGENVVCSLCGNKESVPDYGQFQRWVFDGEEDWETPFCHCIVEPDGTCPHGMLSWGILLNWL